MSWHRRISILAVLLGLIASGCPRTAVQPHPEVPPTVQIDPGAERMLVSLPEIPLWSKTGGTGDRLATLHQGVVVAISDRTASGWVKVTTEAQLLVSGWVRGDALGCRLAEESTIQPQKGGEQIGGLPLGKQGALLRVLSTEDGWSKVESAPEKLTWYETGGKYDPVLERVSFTGFLVQGWVRSDLCTHDQKQFYPRAPKDGELASLANPTKVYSSPGGMSHQLPGKALAMTRWVNMEVDGIWVRGRTDGQIVVHGWVQTSNVGIQPLVNPLYKLVEQKIKDYEILGEQPLLDAKGKTITTLIPGQDVSKIGEDVRGCKIETPAPIQVTGFVPCDTLRDLSTMPEAAIEYGIIDGGGMPPDRGPQPNPVPVD